MAQYELNLRDYIRIARKRKFIIIFTMLTLGFFSFFFSNMQKPVPLYSAFASVKVEQSTTMTGLYLQSLTYDDSDVMETQSTVIKSLPLMEKVTKRMGYIDENLTPQEIRSNRDYLDQVLRLKNMISTDIEGYTNIININVTGGDPKEVQDLANTTAAVFKEENTTEKNKRTIEARKFIEKRLDEVKEELTSVQEQIKGFKEENKFVDEMMEVTDLLRKIKEAEIKLEQVIDRKDSVDLMITQLEKQASLSGGNAVRLAEDKDDPIFSDLNRKRTELLIQREVLLTSFTEKYPEVITLDVQLDEIEKNMINHLKEQKALLVKTEKDIKALIEEMNERHKKLPQMSFTLDDLQYDLENTRELYRDLSTRHQEILIKSSEMIEEVSVIRPALLPENQINPPKIGATTGIGTMIGLILGMVIAFVMETLDTSIGTIEEVETFLGIPVLGVIPLIRPEEIRATIQGKGIAEQPSEEVMEMNARLITHFAPKSNLAESFRSLRTSIKFLVLEKNIKSLMISSSTAREGKSTTMANMALTLAQIGSKVLLVDADLRKPMVARVFGLEREPGLTDIILGNYEWPDTVKTVTDIMMGRLGMEDIMTTPGIDNLNIITAGTHSPNTTELVSSQRMSDFINQAKEEFDIILVDAPPVLQATDSVIISTKVDAVVLVYWAGKIQRGALKRAKTQLDNVNAATIGIVLNGLKPEVSADYKYYGYYSYYGYGGQQGAEEKMGVIAKVKGSLIMPEIVRRFVSRIIRFSNEKEIPERFKRVAGPITKRLINSKASIHDVVNNFLEKHDILEKIIDKFKKVIRILITIMAFVVLIGGLIWQIFYM